LPKNWADVVILAVEAVLLLAMGLEMVRSIRLVWKDKRQRGARKEAVHRRLYGIGRQWLKLRRNKLNQCKSGEISRTGNEEEGIVVMGELQDQAGG
jgi:hypothetical protein